MHGTAGLIACSHLEIGYPGRAVAGGITAGWIAGAGALALTGANGSGKSTFLKTCLGLLRPRAGQLSVLGNPVSGTGTDRRAFRLMLGSIGWVPQQRAYGSLRLKARELVALGLGAKPGPRPNMSKTDSLAVEESLCACGIADIADRDVQELSGGQYQRASIARALAGKPTMLLLDEPTTFLDRGNRKDILEFLAGLARGGGPSIVLVSHDPELISLCSGFWLFADRTMSVVDRREALELCS